ncbi:hypothetical protein DUNSADRAFT_6324 [Dunaliella salina]|uniref:Encoded protein n=1 Tax=Dunaliella salina TaxID=3046 RepID=A0ABQ7GNI3_DUNSA|nr:hypothetical protein DUNSADRAFT_6324 [Dunaliella salina]|eukprot:KAF5836172.1 hypothetical protein DUNSADRAFT_6324 [Dunaliella salina]
MYAHEHVKAYGCIQVNGSYKYQSCTTTPGHRFSERTRSVRSSQLLCIPCELADLYPREQSVLNPSISIAGASAAKLG